jgi:hypothetical protein
MSIASSKELPGEAVRRSISVKVTSATPAPEIVPLPGLVMVFVPLPK